MVAVTLVVVAAVIALASPGSARAQDGASVDIFDFGFDSASLTIAAGTTVTWTNTGNATHTVTADDGTFDSGNIDSGGTYSFTFDTPGTYTYHCAIHPNMTAEIVVTEAGGADTTGDATGNATGDDTSGDTQLPSTGTGTTATHDVPVALFAIAVALMAGGFLTIQRRSAR